MPTVSLESLINPDNYRKLANRTVETYPTEWKVVHEALQNAKDAIRRAERPGRIRIELDVVNQAVQVGDDGTGFPYDIQLLGFGGTDKDADSDWCLNGRQGVGLKAVILSTQSFSLSASHDGRAWQAKINDADKYLVGENPEFHISDQSPTDKPSGTTLSYSFRNSAVSDVVNTILSDHLPRIQDILAPTRRKKIEMASEIYFRSGRGSMAQIGRPEVPTPTSDSDLRNVEFKLDLNDLIDDFEREEKFPNEVSLIIVWEDTLKPEITDYQVVDIDYTPDANRAMFGVDKVLNCRRQNRMIQMLVLKDVVARIENGKSASTTS